MKISQDTPSSNLSAFDLLALQNKAGWWPYKPGRAPSMETTAWAAIALRESDKKTAAKALENLLKWQKSDGGWSTEPDLEQSDWTTQLALIALHTLKPLADAQTSQRIEKAQTKGLDFIMSMRSDMMNDMARILMTIFSGPDFDYPRGWPWEKGNAQWIEPTAYAVMALKLSGRSGEKRFKNAVISADQYLLTKACTPTGWNYGSTHSFSGYEAPTPYATAWALLALQDDATNPTVKTALDYLRKISQNDISIATNALAILALSAYGDDTTAAAIRLTKRLEQEQHNQTITLTAVALSALASTVTPTSNPLRFEQSSRG